MAFLTWARQIRAREAATDTRVVLLSVLAAFVILAGMMHLMASMTHSHSSLCGSILHQLDPDIQHARPSQIFSWASNRILRGGHGPEPNVLKHNGTVGTVTRSKVASVATRAEVTVPQTIWQTARSRRNTPRYGTDLFNSWTKHNPGWDHYFMDDEDVEAFVEAHYNATVLQAYKDLPLGVMKADVFRYMVIHQYGGVYADMDTEAYQPVAAWAPQGCRFAVAVESQVHFCQWAFAAVPGHGALGRVLDLVLQRMISRVYREYIARGDGDFVHAVTGPAVFTEGILDFLGVAHASHNDTQLNPLLFARRKEFREEGVCLLTWLEMQGMLANRYSSLDSDLQKGSWSSWTREREQLMQDAAKQHRQEEQEESQPADEQQREEARGEDELQEVVQTAEQHGEEGPGKDEPVEEQLGEVGRPA